MSGASRTVAVAAKKTQPPLNIVSLVKAIKDGEVYLAASKVRGGPASAAGEGAGAQAPRFFWNRRDHTGSVYLMIGDITKPQSSHPFLLLQPSKHKDSADNATGRGAFTAIPDPEEAEAWIELYRLQVEQILKLNNELGFIKITKRNPDTKRNETRSASTVEEIEEVFAPMALEPTEDKKNLCLWQKLQLGGPGMKEEIITKFKYVELSPVTDAAGNPTMDQAGEPVRQLKFCGSYDPDSLKPSDRVFSLVEMGELKFSQQKWRSMLYVRTFLKEKVETAAAVPAVMMGNLILALDEEDGEASGASAGAAATETPAAPAAPEVPAFASGLEPYSLDDGGADDDLAAFSSNVEAMSAVATATTNPDGEPAKSRTARKVPRAAPISTEE